MRLPIHPCNYGVYIRNYKDKLEPVAGGLVNGALQAMNAVGEDR